MKIRNIMKHKLSIMRATILALLIAAAAVVVGGPSAYSSPLAQGKGQAGQGQPVLPSVPVGTDFSYQGSLKDGANPANGQYDFTFKLFDTLSGGNQVGSTLTVSNQTVTDGLFTVTLDFGAGAITGEARWLEIAVRQAGGGSYTTLSPRQPLTAAPYAQSLVPGAVIDGSSPANNAVLKVTNNASGAYGVWGESTSSDGIGVLGSGNNTSTTATGVYGISGGTGVTGFAAVKGVYGLASGLSGWGVHGVANNGGTAMGVRGESTNGWGVYGYSVSGAGMGGTSTSGYGVRGDSGGSYGVRGDSGGSYGVYGQSSGVGMAGVYGVNTNTGYGVQGDSASTYAAVYGNSTGANGTGVIGVANNGAAARGVWGSSTTGWAGWFDGNVNVTGTCCAASAGTFKIDHPSDPENKYLVQSAVESPDMKSVYDGVVLLDSRGEATVNMPDWFSALNSNFRYQLTCIGGFAPVYIAQELAGNSFKIAGGKAGMKVSWQVTGIRHDPYAQAHPVQVEVDKSADEKGKYIHPELYGQPESKGIDYEELQKYNQQPTQPNTEKP